MQNQHVEDILGQICDPLFLPPSPDLKQLRYAFIHFTRVYLKYDPGYVVRQEAIYQAFIARVIEYKKGNTEKHPLDKLYADLVVIVKGLDREKPSMFDVLPEEEQEEFLFYHHILMVILGFSLRADYTYVRERHRIFIGNEIEFIQRLRSRGERTWMREEFRKLVSEGGGPVVVGHDPAGEHIYRFPSASSLPPSGKREEFNYPLPTSSKKTQHRKLTEEEENEMLISKLLDEDEASLSMKKPVKWTFPSEYPPPSSPKREEEIPTSSSKKKKKNVPEETERMEEEVVDYARTVADLIEHDEKASGGGGGGGVLDGCIDRLLKEKKDEEFAEWLQEQMDKPSSQS
jgi:hypothetical protein